MDGEYMKCIVTGGGGFIGSNIAKYLDSQGHDVTILDNFSTGNKKNIDGFNGKLEEVNITKPIKTSKMDVIFHQAAITDPRHLDDEETLWNNIIGFKNMVALARKYNAKLIYASSASMYGNHKMPNNENDEKDLMSAYARSKYIMDIIAESYFNKMHIVGLRYFNVFGRRQTPDGAYAAVIPKFVKSLIRHEVPLINGDGTVSRDFTYIDNVIQVNHLAAIVDNNDALNQVYNVAHGERTTLNQLFYSIREKAGEYDKDILTIVPEYGPVRSGDIPHSLASIDKAKRLLGYSPVLNVDEGLTEALKWYWSNL